MKVQVTESGTWRRTLEIEAPAEDVEKRIEAAYKKYSKSLNIPGFRKGKVPVNVVKKQFGPAIRGEVVQEMVEEFYREASQAEGIHPVAQADIEDISFNEGQPLIFKASVDVRPEIKVDHYKGLQVKRPIFPVKDEQIDAQLSYIQEQNATEQIVERAAGFGDVLLVDVEELNEKNQTKPATRQEDQRIRLFKDKDDKPSELAEQLLGIVAGETRDIKLKRAVADHEHDHDHEHHDHEGPATFRVTVKGVHERTLPKLDDELAKDVGDYENLEALKTRIRSDMQIQSDRASRRRVEEHLVDALIEQNAFDVPDSMVETYLNGIIESYKREHAGHNHPIDEEAIRRDGRDSALRGVKRYLLLNAISEQEKIEVIEADLDKHLASMAEQYKIEGSQLRQILSGSGQLDQLYSDLKMEKTVDFLIEQSSLEDVEEVEAQN